MSLHHNVYIVLLKASVLEAHEPSYRPQVIDGRKVVYVGMTGLEIDVRIRNHLRGYKSGRGIVRDFFERLLPEIYEDFGKYVESYEKLLGPVEYQLLCKTVHENPMSDGNARKLEKQLARTMAEVGGYVVYGGH
jgi:hypothetical protein